MNDLDVLVEALDLFDVAAAVSDDELAEALRWACYPGGGWPREIGNDRSMVICAYRALEAAGLVREIAEHRKLNGPHWRRHFVGTEAGIAALARLEGEKGRRGDGR